MKQPLRILPVIVISQFCGTSLWFAGNGVMSDLIANFDLELSVLGHLTSAVQLGFITGTLIFALLAIADRFSPSKVFMVCSLSGAFFNLGIIWEGNGLVSLLFLRFLTGFFLAGIYPVGMKIAADYFEKGLGKSLGYLVGALVLGTAFPHLLKGMPDVFEWKTVILATSAMAIFGGVLIFLLVPDGPYRKQGNPIHLGVFFNVFRNRNFRTAAFGYFGHMWELYAFWAFIPVMLKSYNGLHSGLKFNIPVISFTTIGIGGVACVLGGYLSLWSGPKKVAFSALFLSCLCCLISPFMFMVSHEILFIGFLFFWGVVVITDSPLFSTMVAQNADAKIKGSALTIVNCIGFSISILSIQLINSLSFHYGSNFIYMVLALGPITGLLTLIIRKKRIA